MNIPTDLDIEARVKRALTYFESGYNCSQSVLLAYADLIGLPEETASNIAVSFGGGLGRMREVCGTVSAMSIIAGFKYSVSDPTDQEKRILNYRTVQLMAETFKDKYHTISCKELLKSIKDITADPEPSLRTKEYYQTRPCGRFVSYATWITGKMLKEELK